MAAGNTYTQVPGGSVTVGTATSSVTLSSIPSTYTDLVLIVSGTASGGDDILMQFNSDTASNYSYTILYGTGSAAGSTRGSNGTSIFVDYYGAMGTGQNNRIIQINNYSNTTTNKTTLVRANNAASGTDAIVGLWRSTSAINAIKLFMNSATFSTGTTFNLYGIAAA
jgi:hypothetical protein